MCARRRWRRWSEGSGIAAASILASIVAHLSHVIEDGPSAYTLVPYPFCASSSWENLKWEMVFGSKEEPVKLCIEGQVMTCRATDCGYNTGQTCQAGHILVGSPAARCDTFTTGSPQKMEMKDDMSSVRGCDVTECSFNKDMSCDAAGITVHLHTDRPNCLTFRPATHRD